MKGFFLNRDSNTITISTFWEQFLLNKYVLNPPYQRFSIWSDEKQSYFIDSIMKNFPVPPIFLRQIIDVKNGTTKYEVIDGKQRLTSIIRFIKNEIPVANDYQLDEYEDDVLLGLYFDDLDKDELQSYKKRFWSYKIPVEYVDTESQSIIDNIFDRLNRNGEPLTGQELRNAKYHNTQLHNTVMELAKIDFWVERLKVTDRSRMEDHEFISELLFMQIEKNPLHANLKIIDQLYEKYSKKNDFSNEKKEFVNITKVMEAFELDYERLKITGVSHLYGLYCLAWHCYHNNIDPKSVKDKITKFYEELRSRTNLGKWHSEYKSSMSARTKDALQRRRRLDSLINYIKEG